MRGAEGGASYNVVAFVLESRADYEAWVDAIESYVIQSGTVTDFFDIKERLGNGTFGCVYLATSRPPKVGSSYNVAESR